MRVQRQSWIELPSSVGSHGLSKKTRQKIPTHTPPSHAKGYRDVDITHEVLLGPCLKLSQEVKEISSQRQTQWHTPVIPARKRLKQKDLEFQASLASALRCCLKIQTKDQEFLASHSGIASSSLVPCPRVFFLQMLFSSAEAQLRYQLVYIIHSRRRVYWLLVLFVSEISARSFSCRYFHQALFLLLMGILNTGRWYMNAFPQRLS